MMRRAAAAAFLENEAVARLTVAGERLVKCFCCVFYVRVKLALTDEEMSIMRHFCRCDLFGVL